MRPTRALLAAVPVLALSACAATVPFDLEREVPLQCDAGTYETTEVVDLSSEPELWDRRDQIDALSVEKVRAEVVAVGAGNTAKAASLSVAFRPDGAPADGSGDVVLGAFESLPLTVGSSVELAGSPAVDRFLSEVLNGTGRFTAVVSSSVDGTADVTLVLGIAGSVTVKLVE